MTALPSDLSLTNIADGAPVVAADHRNNYSAIQTGFNTVNELLAAGTSGQVLVSGGPTAVSWVTKDTIYRKTTEKNVVSSLAETDLLNSEITVAAGLMGTVGVIRAHLQGDCEDTTGANVFTLRLKFGGTTWWADGFTLASPSATRRAWSLDITIANLAATNAQDAHGQFFCSIASPSTGLGTIASSPGNFTGALAAAKGALAVDTTASAALQVTCQNSTNSASVSLRLESAIVTVTP